MFSTEQVGSSQVEIVNDAQLRAYAMLGDLAGESALLVRADVDRTIFTAGNLAAEWASAGTLLIAVAATILGATVLSVTKGVLSQSQKAPQTRGARARGVLVVGLVVAAGAFLSATGFVAAGQWQAKRAWMEFSSHANQRAEAVREAFQHNEIILKSMQAPFLASNGITREQFTTSMAPFASWCKGVQALEWIPRVRNSQRDDFEKRAHAERLDGFRFTEKDADGHIITCPEREEYYPVYYVVPYAGNIQAVGFDLASEPIRRAAMLAACDSGQPVASARVRLVQERQDDTGILMFLPLYAGVQAPQSVEERRQSLTGYLLVVLRMNEMLAAALPPADKTSNTRTEIWDVTKQDGRRLLAVYPKDAPPADPESEAAMARSSLSLEMGGRKWDIVCQGKPALGMAGGWQAYDVLGMGLALTFMLAVLLVSFRNRHARVQALVASRTAELAESRQYLQTLLDTIDAGVMLIDPATHHIVDLNRGAERLIRRPRSEAIGLSCHQFVCPTEVGSCPITNLGKTVDHAERMLLDRDGREIPIMKTVAPVVVNGRKHLLETFFDIRMQKDAQEEAQQASQRLQKALEEMCRLALEARQATVAKSEFLANMSHEIRTPMNGVMGMIELLLKTGLNDQQRWQAETAYRSAEALLMIVNDILDFSKMEAGKLVLDPVPFDLRALAEDVAQLLAARARDQKLELIVRYARGAPSYLVGDAGRIRQVLLNLVGNAVKFTRQGHVLIQVEQERMPGDACSMHLSVSDTGVGISPEKIEAIFGKFTQADASTTRTFGGTGLGLAISRKLVERMGGRIWAESVLDKGSTFHVVLPLALDPQDSAQGPGASQQELAGRRVLVVDDNPVNRSVLEEMLRGWGMRPDVAEDGEGALLVQKEAGRQGDPFTLAVVDACMPGMDGLDLCRQLLSDEPFPPKAIVMLSSLDRDTQAGQCRNLGIHAYLVKPVREAELLATILKALGKAAQAAPEPVAVSSRPPVGRHLRVLLAEDNPVNQEVAAALLNEVGCSVVLACNGLDAVRAVQRERFDIIFMDVQMPEMGGLEATEKIRLWEKQASWRTPIVAMTAHAMQSDLDSCLKAGMDDCVVKPISGQRVAEVIGRTIDYGKAAVVKASLAAASSTRVARAETADGSKDAINTESLLERCMNNAQIARKVLSRFQESAENTVVCLEQALNGDDVSQAAIHAHTLKGAAASVSAEPLSKAAAEIEQQCKVAATAAARTTLLTLRLELKRCLDSIPGAMDRLAQAVGS